MAQFHKTITKRGTQVGMIILAASAVIAGIIVATQIKLARFGAIKMPPPPPDEVALAGAALQIPIEKVGDNDYARGAARPALTLVEYFSPTCPYCDQFHATMQGFMNEQGQRVKWVKRFFLEPGFSDADVKATAAAECAGEQGRFWQWVDARYSNNKLVYLSDADLDRLNQTIGVDGAKFSECIAGQGPQRVKAASQAAADAGIQYAPTTIAFDASGIVVEQLIGSVEPQRLRERLAPYLK